MLDALDEVPWDKLTHVFGPATDLPYLFRELLSPFLEARQHAISDLHDFLCHQGTVSEATFRAIPFLFELLQGDEVRVRTEIAILLTAIADCYTGWPSNDLAEECRQLVGAQLDVLLPFLRHKEAGIRGMVATALGRYPDKASNLVPLLQASIGRERDPHARVAMDAAVERLIGR